MPNKSKAYYSNGKLLLTAEYFVLYGAKAIALPLKYGQHMTVVPGMKNNVLSWKAFSPEGIWFACQLSLPDFEIHSSTDDHKALILQKIFKTIRQLKPDIELKDSLEITTHTDFQKDWGMGSSSTLIASLAEWAGVDAYKLNELVFKGSGFDIACASADSPILYQREKMTEPIELDYPFQNNLYFVYSGKKKSTKEEVIRFKQQGGIGNNELKRMSELTEEFAHAETLSDFQQLMVKHEEMVSNILHVKPIKETLFPDFSGEIKSLGAWGGDFLLAATEMSESDVRAYFRGKGLETIFHWDELVM